MTGRIVISTLLVCHDCISAFSMLFVAACSEAMVWIWWQNYSNGIKSERYRICALMGSRTCFLWLWMQHQHSFCVALNARAGANMRHVEHPSHGRIDVSLSRGYALFQQDFAIG